MAGIDVGSSGGKRRATNSEINMIPFIDLLMVTVSFLLITAVWATESRIPTSTEAQGQTKCVDDCQDKPALHVVVGDDDFELMWKSGRTVLSDEHVPRRGVEIGSGAIKATTYPELAAAIGKAWQQNGSHKDVSDRATDGAVLHTDNRTTFKEIVAVLDAINGTRRPMRMADGSRLEVAALTPTFSAR